MNTPLRIVISIALAATLLLVLRYRGRPAPTAVPTAVPEAASPSASPARTVSTAPKTQTQRLDKTARADMLQRIEAARRRPAGAAAPTVPVKAAQELDEAYISEQIQALKPLVAQCYVSALLRNPAIGGKLVVDFSIVGDPEVGGLVGDSKINTAESTIADASLRECVQETMYAAQFAAPKAGGEVQVSFPFVFSSN